MIDVSRRELLVLASTTMAAAALPSAAAAASGANSDAGPPRKAARDGWGQTFEGQRCADRGDGTFRNPIMAGANADPSILKDGDDYYLTFSSFEATPGLLIWHSRDLVNWQPFTNALPNPLGSVFAVDMIRHAGRYYIYIPFIPTA